MARAMPMTMTAEDGFSGANYWPEGMAPQDYYQPVDRGFEAKVKERLAFWDQRRREEATSPTD